MKNLMIAATFVLATLFAMPTYADPYPYEQTEYVDVVNRDSSWYVWIDFVGGTTTVIELEGACGYTQDIDLWVYDSMNREVVRSTGNSCSESVILDHYSDDTLKIIVENVNKPHATEFYLNIY